MHLYLALFAVAASRHPSPVKISPVQHLALFCKSRPSPAPPCFWDRPAAITELEHLLASSKAEVLAVRDQANHSALNIAAFHLNAAGVRALITAGADVNNADINGHRPLHHSALSPQGGTHPSEQLLVVEALLAAGASPEATDKQRRTPSQLCSEVSAVRGCGARIVTALQKKM